ncbi:BTAD domain-containing putative transcriptional regulator, partial [Sphaerisporangium sp. NPDC088356]|uniref:AfsR/SARP family transcriptional regulator n=1 Tax=Sphaerisporangium sp. NPDC088356 TaxID=3154871 RepID=UPI003434D170
EPGVLVDAIWAEEPPSGPAHALHTLVSRLRRALTPTGAASGAVVQDTAGVVVQVAGGYRLAVDAADVDALRFERLAAAGRERLRAGDPEAASAALAEAVALWGDHPGAEPVVIAAVAPTVATRLAHVSIEAVADLAEAELSLGRAEVAAARLTGVLAEQTVHERAAALLMDALAAQGRQAEALAVYERVRETLADALGADPGTALRERHLRLLRPGLPILTADASASLPILAPDASASLPAPLTSFIGRDDELARIGSLFTTGRLVTVLGPGGAGKTRLALEAARRHRHEYRDGAWLIDLASVSEPAKVATAVLAGIGLRGGAMLDARRRVEGDELDVLVGELGGRESLLLVDNCEHL